MYDTHFQLTKWMPPVIMLYINVMFLEEHKSMLKIEWKKILLFN